MARRLKTYRAELDGLNDWIVAAPNQKAALEAFGVHQNLFAQGRASVTDEPALVKAASGAPGRPLKRKKGGKGDFSPEGAGSDWSGALKAASEGRPQARRISRAKLDKAEAALSELEQQAESELDGLEKAVAAAERRLESARTVLEQRLDKAREVVDREREAYRKAAG